MYYFIPRRTLSPSLSSSLLFLSGCVVFTQHIILINSSRLYRHYCVPEELLTFVSKMLCHTNSGLLRY